MCINTFLNSHLERDTPTHTLPLLLCLSQDTPTHTHTPSPPLSLPIGFHYTLAPKELSKFTMTIIESTRFGLELIAATLLYYILQRLYSIHHTQIHDNYSIYLIRVKWLKLYNYIQCVYINLPSEVGYIHVNCQTSQSNGTTTSLTTSLPVKKGLLGWDSNPRHAAYEGDTLLTELPVQAVHFRSAGLKSGEKPTTTTSHVFSFRAVYSNVHVCTSGRDKKARAETTLGGNPEQISN